MKKWVPVMMDMEARRVVVVGGGSVAARRAGELADAGAVVTVISPEFHPDLVRRIDSGEVRAVPARYRGAEQLEGAWLAVAATDDRELNRAVCRDAKRIGILWSNVSDAEHSALIMPRAVRRGGLVIAVSTSGASPGLAKRIAAQLETQFGEAYEAYVDFLYELRREVKRRGLDAKRRKRIFESALEFDILEAVGKDRAARAEWMERFIHLPETAETEFADEKTDHSRQQTKRSGPDPDASSD